MTSFPVSGSGNEVIQDGGRKRKGRHFPTPPQWGSKRPPQVLVDVIPAPPSWNQDGGATSNVGRTLGLPWNPQKGVVLVQKTSRRRLKFTLNEIEKHLIVSLPQPFPKWLRELPACHYGEVDQSARVNTTFHETWCWLRQAPTLLFLDFMGFLCFNCTLQ